MIDSTLLIKRDRIYVKISLSNLFKNFITGIPTAQQHLIWNSTELDDNCSLEDYSIYDGATLKMVTSMRGGPINTRRSKYNLLSDYFGIFSQ